MRSPTRHATGWVGLLGLVVLLGACSGRDTGPREAIKVVPVPPPAPAAVIGAFAEASGPVEVRRAAMPYWEPVSSGLELRAGDWVRTGPGGAVRLDFSSGAKLTVEESAVVAVEAPDADAGVAEPAVAVNRGVVRGASSAGDGRAPASLTLRSGGSSQRIVPSAGTTQVDYRVRATESGTEIAVTQGSGVVHQDEQTVELKAGKALVATAESLTAPMDVPDFPASVAPGIDARAVFPLEKPLLLVWKAVPNVVGYRVQVARDLSFTIDAKTWDVTGTSWELKPDARGLYVWRVAARGGGGVVGEYGFARRIYFEAEAPAELLLTPDDGEVIGYESQPPRIAFQWQAAAGAVSYRLSVSKSADPLERPVVSETVDTQRVEVSKLTAGEYTWGVYVRPGMRPVFLAPRKLTVKQMPKPKVTAPKAIQWE